MKRLFFNFLFFQLLVLISVGISFAEEKRPNIVIIMADDLDSRQLSCYGGQNMRTRHIDALAERGLKFNHIIASEAMCIPTRASLFTGLYPARHGAHQNHKNINKGLKSIAHFLGDAGYRVGLTGKDHVTKPRSSFPFQIIPGFESNCVSATDDYYLDSIKTFITKRNDPYCLFIMSTNPHTPWSMGDPNEFDQDRLKLPLHWVDTKLTRSNFAKYLAEVRRLDNQVGEVVDLLRETGQEENTIVIFLGEQGAQFPGGKWNLWDEGQKSSMIIKWPGKVKPNIATDAIVQYEDIAPTLVDVVGGKIPNGLDGRSFLGVIKGETNKHRDYAYGIHNNIPEGPAYPIRSIRSNQYKLILNLSSEKEYNVKWVTNKNNGLYANWLSSVNTDRNAKFLTDRIIKRPAVEFYDLNNDPYEMNNLAKKSKYQNDIKVMREELKKWMEQQGDPGLMMDVPFETIKY